MHPPPCLAMNRRLNFPDCKMGKRPAGRRIRGSSKGSMVFERKNYILLLLGVALVVIGYVMMRMENEVDGFISLYVAPILLFAGYLEIVYAILWRPKARDEQPEAAPVNG